MTKTSELSALLADLRAGNVPRGKVYAVIHTFGNEGFLEAKSNIEAFLNDPQPELRYIALNVLAFHWMCQEHRVACERFALDDPDSDNRRMGVAGLGALLEATKDKKALELLLKVFKNEAEEWDVRDAAYRSILYVLGRHPSEQPSSAKKLDHTKDVNWKLIRDAESIAERQDY